MEKVSDEIGIIPFNQYSTDFGSIDFMDEPVLDQFIDQNEPISSFNNQDYNCNHDQNSYSFPAAELFDFDGATGHVAEDNIHFGLANEEEIEMDEEEESSGSGTAASKKGNRARTLITERRRRTRMKEKLYALRALVPNITKMDKASIVGDAVLYIQDLQMQAKKLKSEIANLQSGNEHRPETTRNSKKMNPTSFHPIIKKIFKIDCFKVEERELYVKIVSNKGKGVAVLLYRALESLTNFDVRTSNLAASSDNYVFTTTLHTVGGEMDVNLENTKQRIASVFLSQGFEFQTSQSV